ncbi:MAG: hypothetical protein KDC23_05785 [Actinobacteria bacterium]|nr:hypothetical protein [Actinomycetota bacterium]
MQITSMMIDFPTAGQWEQGMLLAIRPNANPYDVELWYCVHSGDYDDPQADDPVWRLLAGPTSAGSYVPITPTRVFDSRRPEPGPAGRLAADTWRDISVADGRDLATGAVTVPNLVPPGATAVSINLTVTDGAGTGWVAIEQGGTRT